MMLLTKSETPFLVMGLPLYVGYYAVHDDEKNRLGFVPHDGSKYKGPYVATSFPSIDLRNAENRIDYEDLTEHDSNAADKEIARLEDENARLLDEAAQGMIIIYALAACVCFCFCMLISASSSSSKSLREGKNTLYHAK